MEKVKGTANSRVTNQVRMLPRGQALRRPCRRRRPPIEWKPAPEGLKGGSSCFAFLSAKGCNKPDCKYHHPSSPNICVAYNKVSGCRHGPKCKAVHEVVGPKAAEFLHKELLAKYKAKRDEQAKTPCKDFAAGNCKRGDNCPFLHGSPK